MARTRTSPAIFEDIRVTLGAMTTYSSQDERVLLDIRRTIIIAIASDEVLMERLVLKGGNALDIVYQLSERSSLDIDFSMADDLSGEDELAEMKARMFHALRERFDALGYYVFAEALIERPRPRAGEKTGAGITIWGGYNAQFKLISKAADIELRRELAARLLKKGENRPPTEEEILESRSRQEQVTGMGSERVFTIEISKFEYTTGKVLREVDAFHCYVYTPAMIAAEKLRAICQQLPQYTERKTPAPRPRDFFDIHAIVEGIDCDLSAGEHHELIRQMFAAKRVPLELLEVIGGDQVREFHRQQWVAVTDSVRRPTESFDTYFDFVVGVAQSVRTALGAGSVP
jgi:hypothetical protein